MDQIKIGKFIASQRKSQALTQRQLADRLHVTDKTISKWENARNYYEKMLLIDFLIHEFHRPTVSGTINRRVAVNFIDGTHTSIENILNELSR